MGQPRLQFQAILKTFVDHVYFQPPSNLTMTYPCIVYHINDEDTPFADNKPYNHTTRYLVTIIDRDPDTLIRKKVADLPMSSFDRFFTADELNHFTYNVFF